MEVVFFSPSLLILFPMVGSTRGKKGGGDKSWSRSFGRVASRSPYRGERNFYSSTVTFTRGAVFTGGVVQMEHREA